MPCGLVALFLCIPEICRNNMICMHFLNVNKFVIDYKLG